DSKSNTYIKQVDMMERIFHSDYEELTKYIATELAEQLEPGDVVTVSGNLGAGKTTFTKGIATGLGVKRAVTSPTFTIIKEYKRRLPLYHIDAYRLEGLEEDIGFEEYIDGDGVTVIEWAGFLEDFIPQDRLEIMIEYNGETARTISFKPNGERYLSLLNTVNFPKESST